MLFMEEELYEKMNIKPWPLDLHEAIFCLQAIPYATDSTNLLKKVNFLDEAEKKIINWNLVTIAKSTLYFYLIENMKYRKERNRPDFIIYDWRYITPVILNKNVSKDIIHMLKIFYFCPHEVKIVGVQRTLQKFSLFYRLQISEKSLNDLLLLLEIDDLSRELLIKRTFKEKNFNQISEFLAIYECSIYKNLIFTEALLFYTRAIKEKKLTFPEIEGKINELFDSTKIDLESFEIFDLFESSEQFKSGSNKIAFFSFYQDLLVNLTLDSNDNSIQIFELFEIFLYSVKNKTIFLTNLVFENGSTLQNFIVEFFQKYSERLKKLCQNDAAKYGVSLNTYVTAVISLYVGLLLVFASLSLGTSIRSSQNYLEKKINFSDKVAFFTENEEVEIKSPSETLDISSTQSEGSSAKVIRSSNGSFASLLPTFSRQNYVRGGRLPSGTPQALESSNLGRTIQVSDTRVQQKRILPMNTTMSYKKSQSTAQATQVALFQRNSLKAEKALFEITTTKDAINFVTNEVLKIFPNSFLRISPLYTEKLINGVIEKTTHVTLVGTCVHYSHTTDIKQCLAEAVKQCNGLLVTTKAGLIEFDHGLGTLTQRVLNLTRNEAHAVALYKPEHRLITETRENILVLPPGLGYTADTGGVIELIEGLEDENLTMISNFFQDNKIRTQFLEQGYDLTTLEEGYKHNFSADRQKVSERLEDGVSGNIALAIGIDKVLNETLEEDFERFTANLGRNPTVSGPEAASELDSSILEATKVREHTNAIRPYVKQNTRAAANFKNAENKMISTVQHAYEFVETLGGDVDIKTKQDFLAEVPTQSLEEAFNLANTPQNFGKLVKKPPSVVGARLFVKNYKK